MRTLHKAGCAILGLLLWSALQAADSPDSPQQYDIELLIFQNLVDNDGGEVWPTDYSGWYDEAAGDAAAAEAQQAVKWLPDSSLHMQAERTALDRSSRYRTLSYLAWRQPVVDRDHALALEIPARPRSDTAWVDGTVRVAVERYLHLYLDLQLHLPAGTVSDATGTAGSTAQLQLPDIRLTEQRRMRSKELHYFDNPRFGVIALITPYEPPAGPAAAATSVVPADAAEKPVTAP